MTCSPARLEANRRNAQRSTGPKTDEGKKKSRANSLKHGLCSSVVVAEDADLILGRINEWFFTLKPQNDFHAWLVDQIATISLRIDRAERMERRLRDRRSLSAELAWENDRLVEVEALGRKITARPAEVVEELKRTPTGCDWLISRWAMLAHAADLGAWTDAQVGLAFDLLGTPHVFREGRTPGDILDTHGHVVQSSATQADLARREVDALLERRELAADLDDVDRSLTEADLFDESNPELKRLRRYEGSLFSKFRWMLGELRYVSPHFKPSPELMMRMVTSTEQPPAEEQPAPTMPSVSRHAAAAAKKPGAYENWQINDLHPPFDIEPNEAPTDGTRPDLFQILLSRQEKREKKAESRRESRRRKAERLRA
jgi:hypothetical protein